MNSRLLLLIALILLAGCGRPTLSKIGGYVLEYRLQPNQPATPKTMAVALQQRLRRAGFPAATAAESGELVRIELLGAKGNDLNRAKELILATGHLEFLICAERGKDDELIETALDDAESGQTPLNAGYLWARLDPNRMQVEPWMILQPDKQGRQQVLMVIDPDVRVTGDQISSAAAGFDTGTGKPCLNGAFNADGAMGMGFLTVNNLQRRLGIVFDGALLSAPTIRSKIVDQFQMTGNFTRQEVNDIVTLLRAGALPGRLEAEPVKEEYVEPK